MNTFEEIQYFLDFLRAYFVPASAREAAEQKEAEEEEAARAQAEQSEFPALLLPTGFGANRNRLLNRYG